MFKSPQVDVEADVEKHYLENRSVNKCPHCQFLVREGTRTCEVCHKSLWDDSGVPAFAAGQRRSEDIVAARVGPAQAGFPVSIVWLFVLGLLLAAAVLLTTAYWL